MNSGYPTDETLNAIRTWNYPFNGFWDFIESAWNSNYGKILQDDSLVKLNTDGWSGNEDIVSAMQDNTLFWTLHWQASVRGGVEVFKKKSVQ